MYQPIYTKQFEKDIKKLSKSGSKEMSKLKQVIEKLLAGKKLETKYGNHPLFHNWRAHFECHLESDWLLIYKIDTRNKKVVFVRTGSYSEVF